MKTLEVREINLMGVDFYNYGAYPSDGIFLVNEMTTVDDHTILIYVKNNCALYIGEGSDFNLIESEKPKLEIVPNPKSNGLVSEELFLKAMSLMVNKDESYK